MFIPVSHLPSRQILTDYINLNHYSSYKSLYNLLFANRPSIRQHITQILTSWRWAFLEKPLVAQLLKNFPTFHESLRMITMYTRTIQRSPSWTISIQSIPPHPVPLRYILILSSNLRLGLPSGLYPSGFPTNIVFSPLRTTCPVHLNLLHLIILITLGEEYKLRSSSICSFLHSPVTSSLLGPNILLSTLISLNIRD
jgi:hypothetical protein